MFSTEAEPQSSRGRPDGSAAASEKTSDTKPEGGSGYGVYLDRSKSAPKGGQFRRWLREPLLHFLLLGLLLFAANSFISRGRTGTGPSRQIDISLDDLRQMAIYFQSQWGRPPTPEEFKGLVESKVKEEVLYREGLEMGLDKDDIIVKRRLAQKMQFLSEDVAGTQQPTTAALKAWFEKHSDQFAFPKRVSFRHLYFSPDRRHARAHDDAERALAQLAGQPENSKLAATLADPFMFQDYYRELAPDSLAKEFGPQFSQAVENLPTGSWQGAIESGYGWHLVFVDAVIPRRVPVFEEVESEVKKAWLDEQVAQAWGKAYQDMRAKYTVLLPAAPPDNANLMAVPPPAANVNPGPSDLSSGDLQ
jgi:peptidyl-prolyl cis-trans isomerase C